MKFLLFIFCFLQNHVLGLWDKEQSCPKLCSCRLEHITETAIHRFMQQDYEIENARRAENITSETNEVYYDDGDLNPFNENIFIQSATCIVQTETNAEELIREIPKEVQSLILIQASDSGNKTIKLSLLNKFKELKIFELQSALKLKSGGNTSHFICDIDTSLVNLEYLNLERVILNQSVKLSNILENEANEEVVAFEYVQKVEGSSHPLTFIQHKNEKILPYSAYLQNQNAHTYPLFSRFKHLKLLRIYECALSSIHWEMFEGLQNLHTLLLERNGLRFIPDFAFYGTPNLKSLSLAHNNLLNMQITDLAGLLELEYLDLSNNNFSQLSELSLPPFPKLKLANFANNPITVVFPNTFEVMNTTSSLILGGLEERLKLLPNSFIGLQQLSTLTILHLNIPLLKREIFTGMLNLKVLIMSGNIPEIEYDAFLEITELNTLILSRCNLTKLSIDAFIGLNKLKVLDISNNNLETLSPGIFDDLKRIEEIYLDNNFFKTLPKIIFNNIHPKLIRLNENPWHCTCELSNWKPVLINRIKQKSIKACDRSEDKGVGCTMENNKFYKYVYENRVAPKCTSPRKYENRSVFHVMRKQLKCPDFKPKIKKAKKVFGYSKNHSTTNINENDLANNFTTENYTNKNNPQEENKSTNLKMNKFKKLKEKEVLREIKLQKTLMKLKNNQNNDVNNNIN